MIALLLMLLIDDRLETLKTLLQEAPATAAVEESIVAPPIDTPAAVPSSVNVEWLTEVKASSALTTHDIQVIEHYLVSEPWCQYCPAAKATFLSQGHKPENIVSIAEARAMGESWSGTVPHRFTRVITRSIVQPPSYRTEWPPLWDVEGDKKPSKDKLLRHLRTNSNHAGKHWQSWHLESWSREQLAALHSDDHNGTVKTFKASEPETSVTATIDSILTIATVTEVLASHLAGEQPATVSSSLINIDINAPDAALSIARKLLIEQRWESDSITATWEGGDRTISVGANRLAVSPGIDVTARKSILKVSSRLTGISYDSGLTKITMELSGVPDLTIRFR